MGNRSIVTKNIYIKILLFKQWRNNCFLNSKGTVEDCNELLMMLVIAEMTLEEHFINTDVGIGSNWQVVKFKKHSILLINS